MPKHHVHTIWFSGETAVGELIFIPLHIVFICIHDRGRYII